jgi:hypothetical protein
MGLPHSIEHAKLRCPCSTFNYAAVDVRTANGINYTMIMQLEYDGRGV